MPSDEKCTRQVKAVFSYRASNNDELTFRRGDVIAVTRRDPDDGWWEGTLAGHTGWFPANYVTSHHRASSGAETPLELLSQQQQNRSPIVQDMVESEQTFLHELHTFIAQYLTPLRQSKRLSPAECDSLTSNMDEVICEHEKLLAALSCHQELPVGDKQTDCQPGLGGVFLLRAAAIKRVQLAYCQTHPLAVLILDKNKESLAAFLLSLGAALSSPVTMPLTSGLSLVFRRLEKYPLMLQEYGRYLDENHPDRGDVERSIHVFKDIVSQCSNLRRRKELELEILSGDVVRWEGEPISSLGEVIYLSSVHLGAERRDTLLLLFASCLIMLTISPRMSTFVYEGKILLCSVSLVSRIADCKKSSNTFELSGPSIGRVVVECRTSGECDAWIGFLSSRIPSRQPAASQATAVDRVPPPPPPHSSRPAVPKDSCSCSGVGVGGWSLTRLRATPPMRASMALGREESARKSSRHMAFKQRKQVVEFVQEKSLEQDIVLRIIELYCSNTANTGQTIPVSDLVKPSATAKTAVLVGPAATAALGGELAACPRHICQQLQQLSDEVNQLRQLLEHETSQRERLERMVLSHLSRCQMKAEEKTFEL